MPDRNPLDRLRGHLRRLPEALQGVVILLLSLGLTVVVSALVSPAWPLQWLIEHAPGFISWTRRVLNMEVRTLVLLIGAAMTVGAVGLYLYARKVEDEAAARNPRQGEALDRLDLLFVANIAFLVGFVGARAIVVIGGLADDPSPAARGGNGWLPVGELWLGGYHIHHFFYGFLMLVAAGWLSLFHTQVSRRLVAALYGLGVGIFVDEWGLLVTMGDYYARSSWFAAVTFVALLFAGMVWTWRQTRAGDEPAHPT